MDIEEELDAALSPRLVEEVDNEIRFENEIAAALGPRYVWALHTEPVRILMEMLRKSRQNL